MKSLEQKNQDRAFSSFDQLNDWLMNMPKFASQGPAAMNAYSLTAISSFLENLGNPQDRFFSIHVAGTNGKGSTVRILEQVYSSAGYKVGAFTSPHLIRFNERFRCEQLEATDQELLDFFNAHYLSIKKAKLSYFELSTAFAFWWFACKKVDIAVIETGLGGRLDATNVLEHKMAVITSIGMDHMDVLGDTLEKIALEKAGIMRSGKKVVLGIEDAEIESVLQTHAKGIKADPIAAKQYPVQSGKNTLGIFQFSYQQQLIEVQTHLLDPIQRQNIQSVLAVLDQLKDHYPVKAETLKMALQSVQIPGRFERIHPIMPWYFDGGHNEQALTHLIKTAKQLDPHPIFIFHFMKDKLTNNVLGILSELSDIYLCETENQRSASHCDLSSNQLPNLRWITLQNLDTELSHYTSRTVVFGGSFYFYPYVKSWIEHFHLT